MIMEKFIMVKKKSYDSVNEIIDKIINMVC